MKRFLTSIERFFSAYELSLTERGVSVPRSNKEAIKKLKTLAATYMKLTRVPVYIKCQNTINEFLTMLQVYHAKNKVDEQPNNS